MEGVGRVEGAYLDQRPDLGSWDAVFVGDAIVDHPHRLCIQSLCQLEVLKHSHTCTQVAKACGQLDLLKHSQTCTQVINLLYSLCIQSLCQLKVFRTLTHLHTSSATKACIS